MTSPTTEGAGSGPPPAGPTKVPGVDYSPEGIERVRQTVIAVHGVLNNAERTAVVALLDYLRELAILREALTLDPREVIARALREFSWWNFGLDDVENADPGWTFAAAEEVLAALRREWDMEVGDDH